MTGRSQTRFLPATIQPSLGGNVYVFANSTPSENELSEEDVECFELRPRGKEKIRRTASKDRLDDIVYLVREIQEGDTLNALALQYCCTVADIKRVNNLINDQDFFALRSIKIPVKKITLLGEKHSPVASRLVPRVALESNAQFQEFKTGVESSSNENADSFLREVDRDIERIVKSNDSTREHLNEVVSALSTQPFYQAADRKVVPRKDPHYGADWGMRWWNAVMIMLVVGIVTPLFYLLYYEVLVKVETSHHSTMESTNLPVTQTVQQEPKPNSKIDPMKRTKIGSEEALEHVNSKIQLSVT
ncbi:lysM and putative peptidoglycan-binding domain-containing protein 3 [Pristis pectinata]|uniref:lysM and putative peptidoglycan-binding domain-containing protein 3 n=1 Tax=Pristis pectinata TaxID=685728 RepID=UPI00223CBFD2|nr:lysM and putative peptidoglycan-binding domain-containing protein 3 [Pristis pectinata]XP_051876437.1 lysM and putative peptidoglycan-binding domain-containing protein 3 [Pristis pectinata]